MPTSASIYHQNVNPLPPSDPYSGRTAPLTSRSCILNTYSTNIRTEYLNTLRTGIFFLDINHKSLIQSKVTFFLANHALLPFSCCFIYCVIKCVKSTRVLKGKFA
jgi:hypothetical protein